MILFYFRRTHKSLILLVVFSSKAGETALHSVSGIPPGRANEEDLVNLVQILLEHGANLTFTTYQVNVITFDNRKTAWVMLVILYMG